MELICQRALPQYRKQVKQNVVILITLKTLYCGGLFWGPVHFDGRGRNAVMFSISYADQCVVFCFRRFLGRNKIESLQKKTFCNLPRLIRL